MTEATDELVAYCSFHLGDYKKAMEVFQHRFLSSVSLFGVCLPPLFCRVLPLILCAYRCIHGVYLSQLVLDAMIHHPHHNPSGTP